MRFNDGSTILVTGGAGYIGSHACKELWSRGYQPVVLDDLSQGSETAVKWGPLICADIADSEIVRQTVSQYRIRSVLHFAASAYVGESVSNPAKYYENNVQKTIAFTNALLEAGIRDFIFSSSCASYGVPAELPIAESHPQHPVNPYGDTKLAIEKLLRWYGEAYGLRWVSLRYFNVAGADPQGEVGECHPEETHLVPLALQSTYPGRAPLRVFGDDYATPDGTAIRDFVHVTDVARAHVLALEYLRKGADSRAFNLGTGNGHSVRAVIDEVQKVTRLPVNWVLHSRRPGDPPCLVADPSLARRHLRWVPEHSSLSEMVRTSHNWMTKLEIADRFHPSLVLQNAAP